MPVTSIKMDNCPTCGAVITKKLAEQLKSDPSTYRCPKDTRKDDEIRVLENIQNTNKQKDREWGAGLADD